jgi:hypothetical protein
MVCVAPGQDPPVSIAVSWLFGGIVLVRFHSRYGFRYLSLARYMSDWLIRQIKLSWLVNGNSSDSESQVKMTTVYDSSFGPLKDHFFSLSLIVTINQSKKKITKWTGCSYRYEATQCIDLCLATCFNYPGIIFLSWFEYNDCSNSYLYIYLLFS